MTAERFRHVVNDKLNSNVTLSAVSMNATIGELRDRPKVGQYLTALTITTIGLIYLKNRLIEASNRREVKNNV